MQICLMCKNVSELQSSHAIPDAFFRKIRKSNDGKVIVVPGGDKESIHYSSDSWDTLQLCAACEKHLNESYDAYSIKVLRGSGCKVTKHSGGVTLSGLKVNALISFFVSMFWRAANSKHFNYAKVMIQEPLNTDINILLKAKKNIPLKLATVQISRLIDKTPKSCLDQKSLKGIVMVPFFREVAHRRYSFCFIFEGFFIEIFTPGLKLKERNSPGVLNNKDSMALIPFINVFDIPELIHGFAEFYRKDDGKVVFKN